MLHHKQTDLGCLNIASIPPIGFSTDDWLHVPTLFLLQVKRLRASISLTFSN